MSWFWRGFQSAIFYYVSCAPCTKLNYQRKRRKQNRREKLESTVVEEISAEFYKHPSPFSTNIYWREEMALGPGPPPKKSDRGKAKNGSSRELNTGGQGSSAGASSADTTLVVESVDAVQEAESGEGWNRRRYERPDEILWGFDIDDENASIGLSGISRPGTRSSGTYYTARNPAVNDLHPPVVSTQPTGKSETRWMLQPPPSAKVMEGKERTKRSRSVSGASYGSSKVSGLARHVAERSVEERAVRVAKTPTRELSDRNRGDLRGMGRPDTTLTLDGQRHDRSPRPSADSRRSSTSQSRRKARPPPILITEDSQLHSSTKPNPRPVSRIPSAAHAVSQPQRDTRTLAPTEHPSHPSPTSIKSSSSLHILQELVSPNSALNARAPSPSLEAGVRLPSATEKEERELMLPVCESRFPGGEWGFPDGRDEREGMWQGERGGIGDGRGRWSMDV